MERGPQGCALEKGRVRRNLPISEGRDQRYVSISICIRDVKKFPMSVCNPVLPVNLRIKCILSMCWENTRGNFSEKLRMDWWFFEEALHKASLEELPLTQGFIRILHKKLGQVKLKYKTTTNKEKSFHEQIPTYPINSCIGPFPFLDTRIIRYRVKKNF